MKAEFDSAELCAALLAPARWGLDQLARLLDMEPGVAPGDTAPEPPTPRDRVPCASGTAAYPGSRPDWGVEAPFGRGGGPWDTDTLPHPAPRAAPDHWLDTSPAAPSTVHRPAVVPLQANADPRAPASASASASTLAARPDPRTAALPAAAHPAGPGTEPGTGPWTGPGTRADRPAPAAPGVASAPRPPGVSASDTGSIPAAADPPARIGLSPAVDAWAPAPDPGPPAASGLAAVPDPSALGDGQTEPLPPGPGIIPLHPRAWQATGRRVVAAVEPSLERAYLLSRSARPAPDSGLWGGWGAAAPGPAAPDDAGWRPAGEPGTAPVQNTFNVNVAISQRAGLDPDEREGLEETLTDILRLAARRHGLEV